MRSLLVVVAVFITLSLHAQKEWVGLKGGPSIVNIRSTIGGNTVTQAYNWRPDLHFGFAYKQEASEVIAFKLDVLYAVRGTKYGALIQGYNTNIKLNYLAVPAMVAYRLSLNVDVYAGVELSYLISAKEEFGIINTDLYKNFALGPVVGMSYTAENGVFLEARYGFGMIDINSPADAGGLSQIKDVSVNFDFSIGYYFNQKEL